MIEMIECNCGWTMDLTHGSKGSFYYCFLCGEVKDVIEVIECGLS